VKHGQRGFTIIELVAATAVIALLGSVAAMTVFQATRTTAAGDAYLYVVRQLQGASYWIGRDTQMAESVIVDNLTFPNFIIFGWTEQDPGEDPVHHTVTYSFTDLSHGIGNLNRNHWSDAGLNEDMLVARSIYYDPDDPAGTSRASYADPVLTVTLCSRQDTAAETREYTFARRPDFGP